MRQVASLAMMALLLGWVPLATGQDRNNPPSAAQDRNDSYSAPQDRDNSYPTQQDRDNSYPPAPQDRNAYPPPPSNRPYPNTRYGGSYPNAIAEGTRFIIVLDDRLDTAKLERGKRFKARLGDDLVAPDGSLIPHGKRIRGHVSDVGQGVHPRLILSFDQIETEHGWVPLVATVTGVPGEHGVKPEAGPEGEIERPSVDKRRAAEAVAVGAGVGTLAGAAAGGGKGAAIGAAAGAGFGLGAGILTDRNVRLDKGTQLEVQLDRPLMVPRV